MICTPHQMLFKDDEMDEVWHAWDGRFLRTGCWV
jgi:hypothetical protein